MKIDIEKFKKVVDELHNNERSKGLKLEIKKVVIEPVDSDIELYTNIIQTLKNKELDEADKISILDSTYKDDEAYGYYKNEPELYAIFYINPLDEMINSITKSQILKKSTTTEDDIKKILVPQIFYNYRKNAFLENPELVLIMLLQIMDKAKNKIYKITFDEFIGTCEAINELYEKDIDSEEYIDAFNTIYSLFDLFALGIEINPEEKTVKFGSKLLECFETNLLNDSINNSLIELKSNKQKANTIIKDYIAYFID